MVASNNKVQVDLSQKKEVKSLKQNPIIDKSTKQFQSAKSAQIE